MHLATVMHCDQLHQSLVRPLALVLQCVTAQVHVLDFKLNQLKYVTHPDVTTRELAKATLHPQYESVTHHPELS